MTTVSSTARRGRPREFDEAEVLDAVIGLFWEQGFEAASLADIVDTAGLNKSSLYNSFGSKDELFRRALERYVGMREQMLAEATDGERGIDDLLAVVDLVAVELLSPDGRRGCLAINTTAELGFDSDDVVAIAQRYRDSIRRAMRRPLERAAALGEIDVDLVEVYVDTAMSYLMAASLVARGGAPAAELERHLDSMRRIVESWRVG